MTSELIVFILALVFVTVKLLYCINASFSRHFCVIIVVLSCLYEISAGLLQILITHKSNNYYFAVTGSFINPGAYGGFLAVCESLLLAYYINNKEYFKLLNKQCFSIRLFYWALIMALSVSMIILPSTKSRSAMLGLGCSMIILGFATENIKSRILIILKNKGPWILTASIVAGIGLYFLKKPSADGRLFMDKICINVMRSNGWKGVGHGNFGGAYGEMQACYFKTQIDNNGKNDLDWKALNNKDRIIADCPDNAFNEYLFIGVEEGLIAMLLFIGFIVSSAVVSFKRKTIWCYGLMAFGVFALFSYPLHIRQFQIMFFVLLAACLSDKKGHERRRYKLEPIILSLVMVILSIIIIIKLPVVKNRKMAEDMWKDTKNWYMMGYYDYVLEDGDALMCFLYDDPEFLLAYGQSLFHKGYYDKSDSILTLGTKISSDPMFWNVMGNNSLAQGKFREAEERYKHAFYMVPNRIFPLYLLAKLYHCEGDTARFIEMSDKIIFFKPKVESIKTEQYRSEIMELKSIINNEIDMSND